MTVPIYTRREDGTLLGEDGSVLGAWVPHPILCWCVRRPGTGPVALVHADPNDERAASFGWIAGHIGQPLGNGPETGDAGREAADRWLCGERA